MNDDKMKYHIKVLREILVDEVPDPKSQVEQIIAALLYRFIDDMPIAVEGDSELLILGGEFEDYRWEKIMASNMSSREVVNAYSEVLEKMSRDENIHGFLRQTFHRAFAGLSGCSVETLCKFLRELKNFDDSYRKNLGKIFEYLLSTLGSDGDPDKFRTPDQITDFIVEVIDPKKHEVILDPACGTAGFLLSAYNHILKQNSTATKKSRRNAQKGESTALMPEGSTRLSGDLLTSEERDKIVENIRGYDILPDMVRGSLLNFYLHGLIAPHIEQCDTLTSTKKWGEKADVIFSNPPFISLKSESKPHSGFRFSSKRGEVLFVDYIAQHMTKRGRAAVIVPEGIVSDSRYTDLRKILVEDCLAAVISLPAGAFNPYSGIKTSILILDRVAASASKNVAFFKVKSDGHQIDARYAQDNLQLSQVKADLTGWLRAAHESRDTDMSIPSGSIVKRDEIEGNEYKLNVEYYVLADRKVPGSTRKQDDLYPEYVQGQKGVLTDDALVSLRKYLPKSFKEKGEQDYIRFLCLAFKSNYEAKHYELSSLAFHLLYMSFVSFSVWKIRRARPNKFAMAMVGFRKEEENRLLKCETPFGLYKNLPKESQIFRFLKIIGCSNEQIGKFEEFSKIRNRIAHPTGTVFFNDSDSIDKVIGGVIGAVCDIDKHMKPIVQKIYREFLIASANPEKRNHSGEESEIIENLVSTHYMSQSNIEICRDFDIASLSSEADFDSIKALHNTLVKIYPQE